MVNAIIKGIFWLITRIFSLVLSPFVFTITALFPNLSSAISQISSYLTTSIFYVRSILHLLLIPDTLILLYFNLFIVLNTMFFLGITVYFFINTYNKLKP